MSQSTADRGFTPLSIAAENGQKEITAALIEAKADVNQAEQSGKELGEMGRFRGEDGLGWGTLTGRREEGGGIGEGGGFRLEGSGGVRMDGY